MNKSGPTNVHRSMVASSLQNGSVAQDLFLINLSKEEIADHPFATLFPEMEPEEYQKFLQDIRENGQNEPAVILEEDGKRYVLDGRHRAKALREIGIPLKAKLFSGKSPLDFVVSSNVHRRHLTASQKAMVAAKILNDPRYGIREAAEERKREGQLRGAHTKSSASPDTEDSRPEVRATQQAAALVGASGPSTERAQYVMKYGTQEDVQDVLDGKATVTAKKAEIQQRSEAALKQSSTSTKKPKKKKKSRPRGMIGGRVSENEYPDPVRSSSWEDIYETLLAMERHLAELGDELCYSDYPKDSDLYDTIALMESLSKKFAVLSSKARSHYNAVQKAKKIEAVRASES